MEEHSVTINELISNMMSEMRRLGYSESTLWSNDYRRAGAIRRYYRDTGHVYYDPDVTAEFLQLQKERLKAGEITAKTYHTKTRIIKKLNTYYLTGEVSEVSLSVVLHSQRELPAVTAWSANPEGSGAHSRGTTHHSFVPDRMVCNFQGSKHPAVWLFTRIIVGDGGGFADNLNGYLGRARRLTKCMLCMV